MHTNVKSEETEQYSTVVGHLNHGQRSSVTTGLPSLSSQIL